jgi:hypothetical protein
MQNRTLAMVITFITAFVCGCLALLSCVWGGLIASGTPIDVTNNDVTMPQTFPPTIGFALVCLSLALIWVPVAVGFFTLRRKTVITIEDIPPAS